jgi:hypothetical protein
MSMIQELNIGTMEFTILATLILPTFFKKRTIDKYKDPLYSVGQLNMTFTKAFGLGNYLGYDLPIGRKGRILLQVYMRNYPQMVAEKYNNFKLNWSRRD